MLVIMRHGQASFGAAHYDRLSELGVAQAAATGDHFRLRAARHGEVCIGPRERHRTTAEALLGTWGAAPARRDEAEVDEFADSHQIIAAAGPGASGEDRLQRLLAGVDGWASGALEIEGRPSFSDFRAGVGRWLRREMETATHERSRLVVTSAGVVAAAVCEVMGLPDDAFVPLVCQVRNASLTEIGQSRGRPIVASFNCTGHLPQALLTSI